MEGDGQQAVKLAASVGPQLVKIRQGDPPADIEFIVYARHECLALVCDCRDLMVSSLRGQACAAVGTEKPRANGRRFRDLQRHL